MYLHILNADPKTLQNLRYRATNPDSRHHRRRARQEVLESKEASQSEALTSPPVWLLPYTNLVQVAIAYSVTLSHLLFPVYLNKGIPLPKWNASISKLNPSQKYHFQTDRGAVEAVYLIRRTYCHRLHRLPVRRRRSHITKTRSSSQWTRKNVMQPTPSNAPSSRQPARPRFPLMSYAFRQPRSRSHKKLPAFHRVQHTHSPSCRATA